MTTLTVTIPDADFQALERAAAVSGRPVLELVREALARYLLSGLAKASPMTDLPLLEGHRPLSPLPARSELYDELM